MLQHPDVPFAIAIAASLAAAVTDLWKYRIYNMLTWPLLISGLAYHSLHAGELERAAHYARRAGDRATAVYAGPCPG